MESRRNALNAVENPAAARRFFLIQFGRKCFQVDPRRRSPRGKLYPGFIPILKFDTLPLNDQEPGARRTAVQRERMAFRQTLLCKPMHRPRG